MATKYIVQRQERRGSSSERSGMVIFSATLALILIGVVIYALTNGD